jgi:hypothetical protein
MCQYILQLAAPHLLDYLEIVVLSGVFPGLFLDCLP